jgi:hypothetical protein
MDMWLQIGISFGFLLFNVLVVLIILYLNKYPPTISGPGGPGDGTGEEEPKPAETRPLKASDILGWEFEYARITASEAMQDRHTMINFYLVVVTALGAGLLIVLGGVPGKGGLPGQDGLPTVVGTALLWLLCLVGWLYFLKVIRLRQAWHESARTMNQIKGFYIQHAKEYEPEVLERAFRWKAHTLPPPEKAWTVYFYSAMLIALLDSAAYVAGGILLGWDRAQPFNLIVVGLLVWFGLALFAFHVWMYFAFLRK